MNQEGSRVTSILDNLATSLEEPVESSEAWCSDPETECEEPARPAPEIETPKTWQLLNSNASYDAQWADHSDGIAVKWAELAEEGVLENGPRHPGQPAESAFEVPRNGAQTPCYRPHTSNFQPEPKLVPGTGRDSFRTSQDLEEDWDVALTDAVTGAVIEAGPENMADALQTAVGTNLGAGLKKNIEILQLAIQQDTSGPVELVQGAAEVDVVWELHRELDWNAQFKQNLLSHLGLGEHASERALLQALVNAVASCRRRNPSLRQLQRKFQHLIRQALNRNIEVEVVEPEEDDPFLSLLASAGVTVSKTCRQDIICHSLEEIGC